MPETSPSPVFDRLRRSKYGYVANGWTAFIDNLNRPENAEIAEIIKNDRDFFAHNETVLAAKDVGKLRRAIKLAIGRAGAVAYMERGRVTSGGAGAGKEIREPEWDWRDFTSKVIDAGLGIPKEERRMWILNCNQLKAGEKIKLQGTREEYEVLSVSPGGEAKITGPLGRISAKAEVLVWRPGSQFAEKVSEKFSATDSATPKTDSKKADMRTGTRTTSTGTRKGEQDMASSKTKAGSAWKQNDGETAFGFGMLVRRGKLTGKVIRAHGSKLRVRLDDESGTVEWNADDESIYWKSQPNSDDEAEGQKTGGKASGKSTVQPAARKGKVVEEEPEEEEEEEEIDPDDLPDDDDDLLGGEEEEEIEDPEEEEEEEENEHEEEPEEEEEEEAEGEQEFSYVYTGNDIADKAGVDYQRVQKLKAQGLLDGTFVQAANGRIRYSEEAVALVKSAPKKKPGRPPGGGKKTAGPSAVSAQYSARMADKAPQKQQPAAPQPQLPRQEVLSIPTASPAPVSAPVSGPSPVRVIDSGVDIFADTVLKLEAEIERKENEIERLKDALEVIRGL